MLKIKLTPTGKKHQHHYQIVVMEAASKLTGRKLDTLGHFHPMFPKNSPERLVFDAAKLTQWIKTGAQPTVKVRKLTKV